MNGDTITAIATPIGQGGISIIRLSGPDAFSIAARIFSRNVDQMPSHTAKLGTITDEVGTALDQVLLLAFRDGRSYTGDDTVEIHCHGGLFITKKILALVLRSGARLAEPGEFTLRAFRNGKIDLVQAEAVQDLIGAKNDAALKAAGADLQGSLSDEVQALQRSIIGHMALIEAHIDYPEEGLEQNSYHEMIGALQETIAALDKLEKSFHDGKKLRHTPQVALMGRPNVGKSSLMNALLEKERAIVTAIAGTTRDVIEEACLIGGFEFSLVDTAGPRGPGEENQRGGIRRAL